MAKPEVTISQEHIAQVPDLHHVFLEWVKTLEDDGGADGGPWLLMHPSGGVAIMFAGDFPLRWNDVEQAIDDLQGFITRNQENRAPLN